MGLAMKKDEYVSGQEINNVVFLHETEPYVYPSGKTNRKGLFLCPYCKKEFSSRIESVKNGHTKSCGCYKVIATKEAKTRHGLTHNPIYKLRSDMMSRCYNEKTMFYHRYGGRGIEICSEWLHNFDSFYNWAINNRYKKGLTIDRIDNNGNYEPTNCRFVSHAENVRNSTTAKININQAREIRELKLSKPDITLKELSLHYGLTMASISDILNNKKWVE